MSAQSTLITLRAERKKKTKSKQKEEKKKEKSERNGTWGKSQKETDIENAPTVSKIPSLIRVERPAEVVVSMPSMDEPLDVSVVGMPWQIFTPLPLLTNLTLPPIIINDPEYALCGVSVVCGTSNI